MSTTPYSTLVKTPGNKTDGKRRREFDEEGDSDPGLPFTWLTLVENVKRILNDLQIVLFIMYIHTVILLILDVLLLFSTIPGILYIKNPLR